MASMSITRSVISSTGTLPCNVSSKNQLLHCMGCSPIRFQSRRSFTTLRCMAEDSDSQKATSAASRSGIPPPITELKPEPPATPSKPKVSTKFTDILAFSGPAPERINGRLAMVGFVAAMAVELFKGQDLMSQISEGGVSWFVATSILLSAASLIPFFKGVRVESQTKGFMNANAELWNGRFAMLGLVALAFTEYVKGSILI